MVAASIHATIAVSASAVARKVRVSPFLSWATTTRGRATTGRAACRARQALPRRLDRLLARRRRPRRQGRRSEFRATRRLVDRAFRRDRSRASPAARGNDAQNQARVRKIRSFRFRIAGSFRRSSRATARPRLHSKTPQTFAPTEGVRPHVDRLSFGPKRLISRDFSHSSVQLARLSGVIRIDNSGAICTDCLHDTN